jgi:hypothetical protein
VHLCISFMAKNILYYWNYGQSWWKCINCPSYAHLLILDVENVNLQHSLHLTNVSNVDVVQLAIVQVQIAFWKSHVIKCSFVHMVFFFLNDNLLVDLANPQMLWHIICRSKQTIINVLMQRSIILPRHKGHVDFMSIRVSLNPTKWMI